MTMETMRDLRARCLALGVRPGRSKATTLKRIDWHTSSEKQKIDIITREALRVLNGALLNAGHGLKQRA